MEFINHMAYAFIKSSKSNVSVSVGKHRTTVASVRVVDELGTRPRDLDPESRPGDGSRTSAHISSSC